MNFGGDGATRIAVSRDRRALRVAETPDYIFPLDLPILTTYKSRAQYLRYFESEVYDPR